MSLDDWLGTSRPKKTSQTSKPKKGGKKKGGTTRKKPESRQELIEEEQPEEIEDFPKQDEDELDAGNKLEPEKAKGEEKNKDGEETGTSGARLKSFLSFYTLTCTKCKFKKRLRISGEPKPHHLVCRSCGAEMRVRKG